MALATLISLLGYVFLLYAAVRRHTALVLLAALSGMLGAIYLGGLFDLLRPTATLVFLGGLASFGVCLTLAARRRISLAGLLGGPEIYILLGLGALHLFLFRDATLFFWDEFSHWALAVKEMYGRGVFYAANPNMSHAYYPPAASLWLYYTVANSRFSEPVLYFAQFIFVLAPTFVLYKNVRIRQLHWILAALVTQVFLLAVLGHGVANLLVDHVLGAWFGGILVIYLSERYTPAELLLFAPALCVLALIKDLGLFLACGAGVFMVGRQLWLSGESGPVLKRGALLAACLVLLSAGPLAAYSWNAWLNRTPSNVAAQPGKASGKTTSVTLERVRAAFSKVAATAGGVAPTAGGVVSDGEQAREEGRRATVKTRFWEVLLRQPLGRTSVAYDFNEYSYGMLSLYKNAHRLSAVGWTGFFLALCAAACAFAHDAAKRKTIAFTASYLLVFSAIYFLMLLYLYLAIFDPGKGEGLASYDRYVCVMIMPLVFVGLALHFPLWTASGAATTTATTTRAGASRLFLFPLLAALLWFEPPYYESLYSQPENNFFRKDIAGLASAVHAALGKDDTMYVVFPVEESGLFRTMLTYDFAPVLTTASGPDILDKAAAELVRILARYDYVLFPMRDGSVRSRFQEITPDALESRLYRVRQEHGDIWLEPVL